jgi:hypothetical protein
VQQATATPASRIWRYASRRVQLRQLVHEALHVCALSL